MTDDTHFQVHPDYTDDDSHYYAVDSSGHFFVLAASVLEDDRLDQRELSSGMYVLAVPDAAVDDVIVSDTVDPAEIPLDDMGL